MFWPPGPRLNSFLGTLLKRAGCAGVSVLGRGMLQGQGLWLGAPQPPQLQAVFAGRAAERVLSLAAVPMVWQEQAEVVGVGAGCLHMAVLNAEGGWVQFPLFL